MPESPKNTHQHAAEQTPDKQQVTDLPARPDAEGAEQVKGGNDPVFIQKPSH